MIEIYIEILQVCSLDLFGFYMLSCAIDAFSL